MLCPLTVFSLAVIHVALALGLTSPMQVNLPYVLFSKTLLLMPSGGKKRAKFSQDPRYLSKLEVVIMHNNKNCRAHQRRNDISKMSSFRNSSRMTISVELSRLSLTIPSPLSTASFSFVSSVNDSQCLIHTITRKTYTRHHGHILELHILHSNTPPSSILWSPFVRMNKMLFPRPCPFLWVCQSLILTCECPIHRLEHS